MPFSRFKSLRKPMKSDDMGTYKDLINVINNYITSELSNLNREEAIAYLRSTPLGGNASRRDNSRDNSRYRNRGNLQVATDDEGDRSTSKHSNHRSKRSETMWPILVCRRTKGPSRKRSSTGRHPVITPNLIPQNPSGRWFISTPGRWFKFHPAGGSNFTRPVVQTSPGRWL